MRDYNMIGEDGGKTPVAQMSTTDIQAMLNDGFELVPDGFPPSTEVDVRERLRIELMIRSLGL